MVTNDVFLKVNQSLQKNNINYIIVPTLYYSQATQSAWKKESATVLNTASKLNLFKLNKDINKLVYLDADSFFFISPDELFKYPDGAMYNSNDDKYGFSGLFVCIPNNHSYEYYQTIIQNCLCVDGDLLGQLWFPFQSNPDYKIPYEWFINIVTLNDNVDFNKIKGIHFCNKFKPWKYTSTSKYLHDLHQQFPQAQYQNQKKIIDRYIKQYTIPILDNKKNF